MSKQIADKVIDIILAQMGGPRSAIKLDTDLFNDLNIDSLDAIELVMAVEEEFVIDIPDGDVDHIRTVAGAIAYVESQHLS